MKGNAEVIDYRKTILVVEDEEKLRNTIKDFLTLNSFEVLIAENGKLGLDLFFSDATKIDMILLDIMLPYIDGYTFLKKIREASNIPVIMLTAKNAVINELKSFDGGADDFVKKPFLLSVLLARMEAVFKRVDHSFRGDVEAGAIRIDRERRNIYLNDKLLSLTPKEYDLLLYLVENQMVVLSREQILDAVWSYDYEGGQRTVDTIVKQVRKKLGEDYPYIQSLYGVGYKFEVYDAKDDKE